MREIADSNKRRKEIYDRKIINQSSKPAGKNKCIVNIT